MHPLLDPNTYTATIYFVVCTMYLRDKHDHWTRWVLAAAALLLALCALMKVERMHEYMARFGLDRFL